MEGVNNRIPDLLSRWHMQREPEVELENLTVGRDMSEIRVGESDFVFSHHW